MKKKRLVFMCAVLIMACLSGVFVTSGVMAAQGGSGKYLFDDAALFSESESEALREELSEIREKQALDVIIVTTQTTEGKSARAYADDFLDNGGYGYGDEKSAILLLIDMGNREIYISTQGAAIDYFSDARIELMLDHIYKYAADDRFYKAAKAFLKDTDLYMNVPRDVVPKEPLMVTDVIFMVLISCLVGAAAALAAWLLARKGTRVRVHAGDYLMDGSVRLTAERDILVNSITTKRHIERDTDSHSGGGGEGSSTHMSSGGVSHGGGGRSF